MYSKAEAGMFSTRRARQACIHLRGGGAEVNRINGPCIGIDLGTTYRLVPHHHTMLELYDKVYTVVVAVVIGHKMIGT